MIPDLDAIEERCAQVSTVAPPSNAPNAPSFNRLMADVPQLVAFGRLAVEVIRQLTVGAFFWPGTSEFIVQLPAQAVLSPDAASLLRAVMEEET